ncbi:Mrpl52 (predicted) [Pycnogonum litorale]
MAAYALSPRNIVRRLNHCIGCSSIFIFQGHSFHTSVHVSAAKIWREKHGLPRHWNTYGPLVDLPDWSFKDGTPAPLSRKQQKKVEQRKELALEVIKLLKEIDFAVEAKKLTEKEHVETFNTELEEKLKPKGHRLLPRARHTPEEDLKLKYEEKEINRADNSLPIKYEITPGMFLPSYSLTTQSIEEEEEEDESNKQEEQKDK